MAEEKLFAGFVFVDNVMRLVRIGSETEVLIFCKNRYFPADEPFHVKNMKTEISEIAVSGTKTVGYVLPFQLDPFVFTAWVLKVAEDKALDMDFTFLDPGVASRSGLSRVTEASWYGPMCRIAGLTSVASK